jgi:hypothetical protein
MFVSIYQFIRRHFSEDYNLHCFVIYNKLLEQYLHIIVTTFICSDVILKYLNCTLPQMQVTSSARLTGVQRAPIYNSRR